MRTRNLTLEDLQNLENGTYKEINYYCIDDEITYNFKMQNNYIICVDSNNKVVKYENSHSCWYDDFIFIAN